MDHCKILKNVGREEFTAHSLLGLFLPTSWYGGVYCPSALPAAAACTCERHMYALNADEFFDPNISQDLSR